MRTRETEPKDRLAELFGQLRGTTQLGLGVSDADQRSGSLTIPFTKIWYRSAASAGFSLFVRLSFQRVTRDGWNFGRPIKKVAQRERPRALVLGRRQRTAQRPASFELADTAVANQSFNANVTSDQRVAVRTLPGANLLGINHLNCLSPS
jgi:hypothetical protein